MTSWAATYQGSVTGSVTSRAHHDYHPRGSDKSMSPYRESNMPARGHDWKGLAMRLVTVCWGLALGCGGAFFGIIAGSSVAFDVALKGMLGTIALGGLIGGIAGYVANHD